MRRPCSMSQIIGDVKQPQVCPESNRVGARIRYSICGIHTPSFSHSTKVVFPPTKMVGYPVATIAKKKQFTMAMMLVMKMRARGSRLRKVDDGGEKCLASRLDVLPDLLRLLAGGEAGCSRRILFHTNNNSNAAACSVKNLKCTVEYTVQGFKRKIAGIPEGRLHCTRRCAHVEKGPCVEKLLCEIPASNRHCRNPATCEVGKARRLWWRYK